MTSPVGKFAALEQRIANLEEIVARLVLSLRDAGVPLVEVMELTQVIMSAAAPDPTIAPPVVAATPTSTPVVVDQNASARDALMAELRKMTELPAQFPSNGTSS